MTAPLCINCKHCIEARTPRKKTYTCALNNADCYTERATGDCGKDGKSWEGN